MLFRSDIRFLSTFYAGFVVITEELSFLKTETSTDSFEVDAQLFNCWLEDWMRNRFLRPEDKQKLLIGEKEYGAVPDNSSGLSLWQCKKAV